jgi:D-lactate dehydrogenase
MIQFPLSQDKISTLKTDLYSFSVDAGFYRLVPKLIARPEDEADISELFRWANQKKEKLTFRAAGTSLSGQSVTDGVLVDITRSWKEFQYDEGRAELISGPSVVAGIINNRLAKFSRKLGPDPASINSCTIGGIVANNSSGMRSGLKDNAYNSVNSLRIILPSGIRIDTSDISADNLLKKYNPLVFNGIADIRDRIRNSEKLKGRIISKSQIKSTIGYSIQAFLDYDSPSKILQGLMCGSEGTLGFISEIRMRTIHLYKCTFLSLVFFKTLSDAISIVEDIRRLGASAIEILDSSSLMVSGINGGLVGPEEEAEMACLLIEFEADEDLRLEEYKRSLDDLLRNHESILNVKYAFYESDKNKIWSVRKSILPLLGKNRPSGTTLIIEDICVPLENLGRTINGLKLLLNRFGYANHAVYGHCLDGNVHFIVYQNFDSVIETERYRLLMEELSELVLIQNNGTLKAEHGTGRNMAPYVMKEWGEEIYSIFREIKTLIDPGNILNPGIILNDDDRIHIKNIKSIPKVNNSVDLCIDCGFCESSCPSRTLTLSPRRRINVLREIRRGDFSPVQDELNYYLKDTCAVDSICALRCPLGIDTGKLTKELREAEINPVIRSISIIISGKYSIFMGLSKVYFTFVRRLAEIIGHDLTNRFIKGLSRIINYKLPEYSKSLREPSVIETVTLANPDIIYFPSCVTRLWGNHINVPEDLSTFELVMMVSRKYGLRLNVPYDINDLCCGMSFSSKGLHEAYRNIISKTIRRLYEISSGGKYPILVDSSSCLLNFRSAGNDLDEEVKKMYDKMLFIDIIEYIGQYILPRMESVIKLKEIGIHKTCSVEKLGLESEMNRICRELSDKVYIPDNSVCCGSAGDRGMMYPELVREATSSYAKEITESANELFFSTNAPCEMAMESVSGKKYFNLLKLVELASGKINKK